MSEMVERVAYAIALYEMRAKTPTLAAFCESSPEARAVAVAQSVETYGETARAAIEAMREPTQGMTVLGASAMRTDDLDPTLEEVSAGYRAMIDAALRENEPSEP